MNPPQKAAVFLGTLMSIVDATITMHCTSSITEINSVKRVGLGVLHASLTAVALHNIVQRRKGHLDFYLPVLTLVSGLFSTIISTGAAASVVTIAGIPMDYASVGPFIKSFLLANLVFLIADLSFFVLIPKKA